MKIDCYLSTGCSSEEALKKNIAKSLELEGLKAQVNFKRITNTEAEKLGLKGSPSILVNGKDIQPIDIKGFS